jgi:hypothetical protein
MSSETKPKTDPGDPKPNSDPKSESDPKSSTVDPIRNAINVGFHAGTSGALAMSIQVCLFFLFCI